MERTAVHRAVHRGAPTAFPAPTMRRRATTGRRACSRRLLRGGVQGWSEPKIDVRVGSVRALRKRALYTHELKENSPCPGNRVSYKKKMQSGHQQHVCERRTDPQVPGGVVVAQAPRRVQDVERAQLARDAVVAGYVKDTNVTIGSGDLVPCAPWVVVVVVGGGEGLVPRTRSHSPSQAWQSFGYTAGEANTPYFFMWSA